MQSTSVTNVPTAKISLAFEQARREGRGVLIPYFMCGYPSAARSIELIQAAAQGGADIIELGIPFSDPLADGATIQHAGHVALERGMTITGCMEVARQVSSQSIVPLLFMGYYNPILAYGIEHFCHAAADSGVSGLIIPDLPPEEAGPLQQAAQRQGLSLVFLIPPTTSNVRIAEITRSAANSPGSFIYCVSLSGVTGARNALPASLQSFIERVREHSQAYHLPLAVGFGLSTHEHIAEVTSYADGAVVGSALVNLLDRHDESEQVEAVMRYIQSLRGYRMTETH
jgi:tryptophan synthase alpha chain